MFPLKGPAAVLPQLKRKDHACVIRSPLIAPFLQENDVCHNRRRHACSWGLVFFPENQLMPSDGAEGETATNTCPLAGLKAKCICKLKASWMKKEYRPTSARPQRTSSEGQIYCVMLCLGETACCAGGQVTRSVSRRMKAVLNR